MLLADVAVRCFTSVLIAKSDIDDFLKDPYGKRVVERVSRERV